MTAIESRPTYHKTAKTCYGPLLQMLQMLWSISEPVKMFFFQINLEQ